MTEKEVQLLGFKRREDNSDTEAKFHYYVYDLAEGISFITNSSDEAEIDGWYVEFYDTNPRIRFSAFEDLQVIINKLEKCKV
jgi:hypothetical protein